MRRDNERDNDSGLQILINQLAMLQDLGITKVREVETYMQAYVRYLCRPVERLEQCCLRSGTQRCYRQIR